MSKRCSFRISSCRYSVPTMPAGPSICPGDSHFYACDQSLGCCTLGVCNDLYDCPKSDLKSTNVHATNCSADSRRQIICENAAPLSTGCCKSNLGACSFVCPQKDDTEGLFLFETVRASILLVESQSVSYRTSTLASPIMSAKPTDPPGGALQETPTEPIPAAPTPGPSIVTANIAGQPALQTTGPNPKTNTAAIAGGVVGGVVGVALLVGLIAIICRHRINKSRQRMDESNSTGWGPGQGRSRDFENAELDEMKNGPSSSKSHRMSPPSRIGLIASSQHPRLYNRIPLYHRHCFRLHQHHPCTRYISRKALSKKCCLIGFSHPLALSMRPTTSHLQNCRLPLRHSNVAFRDVRQTATRTHRAYHQYHHIIHTSHSIIQEGSSRVCIRRSLHGSYCTPTARCRDLNQPQTYKIRGHSQELSKKKSICVVLRMRCC